MQTLITERCKDRGTACNTARRWRYLVLLAGIGCLLLFGLDGVAQAAGFNPAGSMGAARQFHTATLLDSGGVLIAGGYANPTTLNGAELYNATTGTYSSTGGMNAARRLHTATRLNDSSVLIVGGIHTSVLSSAELYNPATGTFLFTGSMTVGRQLHTATLLTNGTVLITGGRSGTTSSTTLDTALIYNPSTGLFTATSGPMNQKRAYHTATLLSDGKVLIAGGIVYPGSTSTATAEIYNPETGLFTATANMTSARNFHAAVLLTDNTVLITGGAVGSLAASLDTAEIFNPAGSGSFSSGGTMNTAHSKHTATLLANNTVLIAGSQDYNGGTYSYSSVAEIYAPGVGFITYDMTSARTSHTGTRLANGMVLLAGGQIDASGVTGSAELFNNSSMTVVPSVYPFPTTFITQTAPAVFTISNDSDINLLVSTVSISGPDSAMYAKSGTCGTLLSQGGQCTITVTFVPTTAGLKSAWLDIDSDDPVHPHLSVHLSGTGRAGDTSQTITVTTPAPGSAVFNGTFLVAATASSGLGVAITSSGACSGSGTGSATITMTSSTGTCSVQYNQAGNVIYNTAPQVTSSTTAGPALFLLTVTHGGTGSGSVNSDPAGIACITGECSAQFDQDSMVTLMPLGSNSSFSGWNGTCSNQSGNNCLVTMNMPQSVTAIFTADPATVTIDGDATRYYTIHTALDAILVEGKSVKVRDQVFTEDIFMTSPVTIILDGGYSDTGFTTRPTDSYTVIYGSLTITNGALTVDQLVIR